MLCQERTDPEDIPFGPRFPPWSARPQASLGSVSPREGADELLAFMIFDNLTLDALEAATPTNEAQLLGVPCPGPERQEITVSHWSGSLAAQVPD